jgi:tetratricopeptide (TPR) repeat protein
VHGHGLSRPALKYPHRIPDLQRCDCITPDIPFSCTDSNQTIPSLICFSFRSFGINLASTAIWANDSAQSLESAFELSDRLPAREHYFVEGLYYSRHWDTYADAADSFRKALALDASLISTRHQLAMLYGKLEMFTEAIELWEALRENAYVYAGIENGLAHMNSAMGEHARGELILQEMLSANPGRFNAHLAMGLNFILSAKVDEALEQFQIALELMPAGPPYVYVGMFRAHMIGRNHAEAREVADIMLTANSPFSRWRGHINLARLDELHGLSERALDHYRQAL